MRVPSTALFLLAGSLLVFSAPGRPEEPEELLRPGQPRERAIAEGETHVYHLDAGEGPVVVTVEQQGIDLIAEGDAIAVDSPNSRWGPEVLVVPAAAMGQRIEVRSGQSAAPGRYTIRAEALDARRGPAFQAMSRAGQLVAGSPEARHEALSAYREALAVWRALGERRWEAEAVLDIAALEQQMGDLGAAVADLRQALALWRALSEPRRVADVLNLLGRAQRSSGNVETVRAALEEALALWRSLGEKAEEKESRNELCLLEQTSGSPPAARACFEELLALHREQGNLKGEATVRNNIGGVFDLLGEPDAALDQYGKALALWQELGDRTEQARTLNNIAVVHRALGEWQEALRVYGRVRELLPTISDHTQKASLLNNVGFAYNSLGEPQRALTLFEEALKLRRETGDRRGEVITLNNLGAAWRDLGDSEKALDHHRQALERAVALGDLRQQAHSRLGLSQAHLEAGDPAAALREIDPALAYFREIGLRGREAQALQVQGRALALAGRPREALPKLREVLERHRTLRDRAGEAEALHALATVERSLGLLDEARSHAEQAVAQVEELRTGFVSPDLRAAFLATRRRAYELRIDLLMDRHAAYPQGGHDRAAFEISEQARARTLLDSLLGGAGRTGSAAPAALLERRQLLRRRLSVKAGGGKSAEGETETLLAELDGVEAEIRRNDPRYAAFSEPPSIGPGELARLLDPGTLLLEYALGEERSFLWAVDAKGLRSFVLPRRKEIERLVREVYEELSTVGTEAARQAEAKELLSRILLGPVWGETGQIQRLIVVPDGALHVLSFAALPVPGAQQPLLERQEVVYIPSATTLALERQRLEGRPPAPMLAAVLADPVFGQESGFERLPSSRREADAISALAPAGQVWSALDYAASREGALSGKLRSYRIVHFATHGVADTRNPEMSGLVLSLVDAAGRPREGYLGLTDIYELDLAADLVVLSGCRTALGKEVRGEGLMGLTRGFLYAGVPRVVGSLWPVQDRTTAELMSRFYKAMWQGGLPPAAALRAAQRSLRAEPRYRDPYSWAGFVLQGDWR
ncbi:MAG TPA: CHAT domain-containing tetratricopeptide repeat protein [Thermoanaerobaculia bacterium]|jgi:CHAT domain-containing protein/tetratricopeptide (TPR) repeat protein|nr:CHAT domain-containing tetratricopeptide repeat protein [Thermoanaerobaculia bacterium]